MSAYFQLLVITQPYFHLRLFLNCSSVKGEPSSLSSLLSSSTTSVDTSKLAQILAVAVDQERYLCYWILFNGKNIAFNSKIEGWNEARLTVYRIHDTPQ